MYHLAKKKFSGHCHNYVQVLKPLFCTTHLVEHHIDVDFIVHVAQWIDPDCALEDEVIVDFLPHKLSCHIQNIFLSTQLAEHSIPWKHRQSCWMKSERARNKG